MSSYLDKDSSDEEVGPVDPVQQEQAIAEALAQKDLGNEAFKSGDYDSALESYTAAVNVMKAAKCKLDPVILLNRSATYLALKRYVPALYDANQAGEIDPTNWKAHWRQGMALGGMARKSFRAKQAVAAFSKCAACESLPDSKKAEVNAALQKARQVMQAIDDATPMPDMSNCMPS
jgi:tetratricopeptide (TPR) repeat protein